MPEQGEVSGGSAPDACFSSGGSGRWSDLAAGPACSASFDALCTVPVIELSGAELVDAIVASEKALSALSATQMRLLTEFARPGRAGDVSGLVASLVDKGGLGHRPDGTLDTDVVETIVRDRAQSLAAAEVVRRCGFPRSPRGSGCGRHRICVSSCRTRSGHWPPGGSTAAGHC